MTAKFVSGQRVRLTQQIDRLTGDSNNRYLAAGALGTVRSYTYKGKQTYGIEFDRVRDDTWHAGLTVTMTTVSTMDGINHNVIDLCEPLETTSWPT